MKSTLFAVAALVSSLVTASAYADVVKLDGGIAYSTTSYEVGGMGGGRGIGFKANDSFSTSAVGIDVSLIGNANASPYQFQLYSSTDGHTAGTLLKTATFSFNLGNGYQDAAFAYDFQKNTYYVLNFLSAVNQLGSVGTMYSWEGSSPINYGIVSVIDGFEGANPSNYNPLIPHMRLTTAASADVPEPGTVVLMGLALVGFAARRKTRR